MLPEHRFDLVTALDVFEHPSPPSSCPAVGYRQHEAGWAICRQGPRRRRSISPACFPLRGCCLGRPGCWNSAETRASRRACLTADWFINARRFASLRHLAFRFVRRGDTSASVGGGRGSEGAPGQTRPPPGSLEPGRRAQSEEMWSGDLLEAESGAMPDGVEAVYRAVLQRKGRQLPLPATVERLRPGPCDQPPWTGPVISEGIGVRSSTTRRLGIRSPLAGSKRRQSVGPERAAKSSP